MHKYKDLIVWNKSVDLCVQIYKLTRGLPSEEKFGIVSQIRRCAVSIPSNIAEGAGRNSKGEFNQFLGVATGSLFELETQLVISFRLDYINQNDHDDISEKVVAIRNLIYGLQKTLK